MPRLRIGSRGSQLALWQANHIGALQVLSTAFGDITVRRAAPSVGSELLLDQA